MVLWHNECDTWRNPMQKITILLFGLAALFCPNVAAIAIDPAHAVIVTTNTTTRKAAGELRRHVQLITGVVMSNLVSAV